MKYWYLAFVVAVSTSAILLVTHRPERKIPSDDLVANTIIGQQLNKIEDIEVRKEISESIFGLQQELSLRRLKENQKEKERLDYIVYLMIALIPASFLAMNQQRRRINSNKSFQATAANAPSSATKS